MIIFAGGTIAFCMIMAEFFLIKRTSVVTLSVCGIFKVRNEHRLNTFTKHSNCYIQEVATIALSSMVFGDRLTVINIIGLCITLFGIGLYNWLKMRNTTVQSRMQARDHELGSAEISDSDDLHGHERRPRDHPQHMYSMVAESTPILLVDGALTNYRDSEGGSVRENTAKHRRRDEYELQ